MADLNQSKSEQISLKRSLTCLLYTSGMDRYQCRKAWVADLKEAGYLVKIEEKVIPVGGCYRCGTTIEPMLSDQWFVAMEELAKPAVQAAKEGNLIHVPERFEKTYLHWLEEIRDWCISRQLDVYKRQ